MQNAIQEKTPAPFLRFGAERQAGERRQADPAQRKTAGEIVENVDLLAAEMSEATRHFGEQNASGLPRKGLPVELDHTEQTRHRYFNRARTESPVLICRAEAIVVALSRSQCGQFRADLSRR